MPKTLAGLGGDVPFCNVYIDNVIVFSSSIQDHVDHLGQVFGRLRKIGLKLYPQKCRFACPEVLYLGHITSAKGIFPNPEKVQAVQEFRASVNVKGVREFLSIAGYYRRFSPNFSKVARPLHSLTRQDVPCVWTTQCQQAFVKLTELLSSPPVLAYPCFSKPFVLVMAYRCCSGARAGRWSPTLHRICEPNSLRC